MTSGHLYRSCIKVAIMRLEVDDLDNILLDGKMDGNQTRLTMEKTPRMTSGHRGSMGFREKE